MSESTSAFALDIIAEDRRARAGLWRQPRGDVATPTFMPVGTAGTVKALLPEQVHAAGAAIILGNTYHLMLRPGAERVARLGGLHAFMRWDGPILTDSGGYQVMSLSQLRTLKESGVTFRSHIDGSVHELTPERAIHIQSDLLGADIAMQLDECPALPAPRDEVARAMELSLRWAERCKAAFGAREKQALFGIVQGGVDAGLRTQSGEALVRMGFSGYAIGGLAVGETREEMCAMLDVTAPLLPRDRVRYVMGVGKPTDLVEAVWRGADIFDCVLPTRSGRHGQAFTDDGPITLTNARFAEDRTPLDPEVACPASRDFSKAYLHHLFKAGELLGQVLLSWHNIAYYEALMARMRAAIIAGRMDAFRESYLRRYAGAPD